METRHLLLAGRLAAVLGVLALRGRARAIAWSTHDLLWLYPTLRRNCSWHGQVLTRFQSQERAVWLTIDDGPDPENTPRILDMLAEQNAKATFFVIGEKAERHPEVCRRIVSEGHGIENHTYSHPAGWWWVMPRPLVRREIGKASAAIKSTTGRAPRFFRSPVGMNNSSVHPAAAELALRVVGWSVDGCDGCLVTPTAIVRRIMRAVHPGAIVLIHENGPTRHRLITIARLTGKLHEAGYRCLIPSEHSLC
jgi:peptidoglycan-N-acetylglucosamine deacetylase